MAASLIARGAGMVGQPLGRLACLGKIDQWPDFDRASVVDILDLRFFYNNRWAASATSPLGRAQWSENPFLVKKKKKLGS